MGASQSPSPPHQYPQAIQLKLYQAFIFSIPILFSIILFLLFYLFYLKRRASAFSSSPPVLPRTITDASSNTTTPFESDLKEELKNRLYTIAFDEYQKSRDSMCCVCLGEFELQEELLQVPTCKHMFHIDCIRLWLHSNSTCPLCRVPVMAETKFHHPQAPTFLPNLPRNDNQSNHQQEAVHEQQRMQLQEGNFIRQQHCLMPGGSSSNSGTG